MMNDKTLIANKGPLQKSLESEALNNLIQFAIRINNDIMMGKAIFTNKRDKVVLVF